MKLLGSQQKTQFNKKTLNKDFHFKPPKMQK
jgi:hypothetical protein